MTQTPEQHSFGGGEFVENNLLVKLFLLGSFFKIFWGLWKKVHEKSIWINNMYVYHDILRKWNYTLHMCNLVKYESKLQSIA